VGAIFCDSARLSFCPVDGCSACISWPGWEQRWLVKGMVGASAEGWRGLGVGKQVDVASRRWGGQAELGAV
jgi:hypothetical protein